MTGSVAAMDEQGDRGGRKMDSADRTRASHSGRRNVRLALAHALLAAGFLAAFVWVTVHR